MAAFVTATMLLIMTMVSGGREVRSRNPLVGYCKISNCAECETHFECGTCEKGYFKKDGNCYPCSDLDTDCLECDDHNTCTVCSEYMYPFWIRLQSLPRQLFDLYVRNSLYAMCSGIREGRRLMLRVRSLRGELPTLF